MFVQDPHLKRSFKLMMHYSGATTLCMFVMPSSSYYYHFQGWAPLKATDVEKNVMFQEETITSNADLSKDKRSVYRNRKLSKADRLDLYAERPDLDLRTPVDATGAPIKSAMRGGRSAAGGGDGVAPDNTTAAAGQDGESSSSRRRERGDRDDRKARPKSPAAEPASREEKAASLFQSHVKAGTLVVRSVVPAGGSEEASGRVRSGSRSRSTSFHSGVSDGKYDLLAPLLGGQSQDKREREQGPVGGAASYPQSFAGGSLMDSEERLSDSRAMSKKSYSLSPELVAAAAGRSGNIGHFQENPLLRAAETSGTPQPMGVVSAGYRSSSTERVVGGNFQGTDLEAGMSPSRSGREPKPMTAEEKEWELRRRLNEEQEQEDRDSASSANDTDDLSSSDDESDDEDKELSIPISAL